MYDGDLPAVYKRAYLYYDEDKPRNDAWLGNK
jgi:hypothetical protein